MMSHLHAQVTEDRSTYILCPKCKSRHLPVTSLNNSGVFQGDCINCGHVFKFKYTSQPKDSISITVNGKSYQVPNTLSSTYSLNAYLSNELHLKGTKKMCYEGGCGCCVVTVTYLDPVSKQNRSIGVNSCLLPIYACDGWNVTTTEGLGNHKTGFHVIQERLADHNGSQCGYCSPGMVMNMYGFLQNNPKATKQDIENAFDGNECRCTGFRTILDAMKSFGSDSVIKASSSGPVDIEELNKLPCKKGKDCCGKCQSRPLLAEPEAVRMSLQQGQQWYRPTKLSDVYTLIKSNLSTGFRLMVGNTSVGVYKGDPRSAPSMIDIRLIPELLTITTGDSIMIGASVTLSDLIKHFTSVSTTAGYEYCDGIAKHLSKVANLPVRNVSSWAGNLMIKHAHPEFPSDVFCILAAVGSCISIADENGSLQSMGLQAFLGVDMKGKIIVKCSIPKLDSNIFIRTYKIMPRSQNAHAYVNAGIRMRVDKSANYTILEQPGIFFGGISKSFSQATNTEKYLVGKSLASNTTLQGALAMLKSEIKPDSTGGLSSPSYRLNLALSLFYRFVLDVCGDSVGDRYKSGAVGIQRPLSSGQQSFGTDPTKYPVTEPMSKRDSKMLAAGETEYVSDMVLKHNELYAKFVVSKVGNAEIDQIDASQALKIPGVVAFLTAKDIPGHNNYMLDSGDAVEEILCSGKVLYAGQPIGIVVTEKEGLTFAAVAMVTVTYKNVQPPIINMDEAIAAGSYFDVDPSQDFKVGDAEGAISKSSKTVSGKIYIGDQYHFHLENQVCRAIPTDDGFVVYPTTQWIDNTQKAVADMLGVKSSFIELSQRRIGGSFGARITRNNLVACACVLAASHTNRPVFMKLTLDDNMTAVGGRHPCMTDYEVGVTNDGKLNGIKMTVYEDAGCSPNDAVSPTIKFWIDNVYHCDNWHVTPKICKTNTPSRTSARAPGSFQAAFLIESIMEHVAKGLNKDPSEVKKLNFYKQGQVTPVGMPLTYCNIDSIVQQVETSSDFTKRRTELESFNKANRWKKKSLAMVPLKWGLGWGGAYYSVYLAIYNGDGSVVVAHGGIESGQGVNTKVAQTVAYELGIPLDTIKVKPSSSVINANNITTGGSVTSELTCYGAIQCCTKLKEKIKPIKDSLPASTTWPELIKKCYAAGIDLAERHYVNKGTDDVTPMSYNCYGACVAEVELDVLTGEQQTNRVDLLHDVGDSINPEIDVGQAEGGFVMGMGCLMTEQMLYDKQTGKCLTSGTWEYNTPTSKDIPVDFRVSFLRNAPNPVGVLGSKAIGEPPICISCVVLLAAKHAVQAARDEIGQDAAYFPLDAPATVEKLHQSCLVDSSQFVLA